MATIGDRGARRPAPAGRRAAGAVLLLLALPALAAAAEPDLSVAWIGRKPRIDYVWGSADPAVEGWPRPGRRVVWVARVRNVGGDRLGRVAYRWRLDGAVVAEGEVAIRRRGLTKVRLPWRWERERHELVFEIDPGDAVAEAEERNNRLLVHTDALAVGVWVERSFRDTMRDVLSRAGIGAATFDDWVQRRILQFNQMAELAVYPETPRGVVDRWRIDAIHSVADGALPLSPPGPEVRDWGADPEDYAVLYPDTEDRSIDMQWGFPAFTAPWFADANAWTLGYDSWVHELGHARYLIDVYAWNVSESDVVRIDPGPPSNRFGLYHATPEHGLMNTSWGFIDRYSAIAMNRIAGHRATRGHYNEPSNIGEFLNDLPEQTRIRLTTPDGLPLARREVRIYRASGEHDPDWRTHPYRLFIDGRHDRELASDDDGVVVVTGNPFADGDVVLAADRNNALAVVEVIDGGRSRWGYLEARQLNLAYWRGETRRAEIDLVVDGEICRGLGLGPDQVTPGHWARVEPGEVHFAWPSLGARRYELWTAVDGRRPSRAIVDAPLLRGTVSATRRLHGERVAWWLTYEDEDAPPGACPTRRTAIYFFELGSAPPSPGR